jgi:UDP:flavonoid glycosyltransferase YjiC (YdhE family)
VATDASELIAPTLRALEFEDLFVVAAGVEASDLEHVPGNARVERFIPFAALMPLVDAYVTNGGYGGVTIALANGVPVIFRRHHRGQGRGRPASGLYRGRDQPQDQPAQ